MEARKFYQYLKAIVPLEAHEQLILINQSMFPNLKQDKRSSIFRGLKKVLRESVERPVRLLDFKDVKANVLRSLGRG
jgi:hypothetical protein